VISVPKWNTHANNRKIRHDIQEYQIAEAWIYGVLKPSKVQKGCWRCIGSEVTLVLSADRVFIITMYPNKFKDKDAAKIVTDLKSIGSVRG